MRKVTVAINVYNGMPYLREAVESILNQSLQDFDLLVINDGSRDGSRAFLSTINDPRLRVIDQQNQGASAASNKAIEACRTEYLARMDADDVSVPDRIESQLAFLEAHPEVGMVGGQTACLGTQGVSSSINLPLTHDRIWRTLNSGHHAMAHPTLMMRTDLIRRVGGYWPYRLKDDDIDVMLRMGEISQLANLDKLVLHYRLRQNSLCGADMEGIRFSCNYAIERGRRRRAGLPEISPEEFRSQQGQRPWPVKAAESLDVYARTQYRLAMEELYGARPVLGRARLYWAALCAPGLTFQRLQRMLRRSSN